MFAEWVLRKIFGSRSDEITEKWRELHKEKLYDLYFSPNIFRVIKSRIMRSTGHVAHMGQRESSKRALVERLEGKRSLGKPKFRSEDNTKLIKASKPAPRTTSLTIRIPGSSSQEYSARYCPLTSV
jgi:hypothetical protein